MAPVAPPGAPPRPAPAAQRWLRRAVLLVALAALATALWAPAGVVLAAVAVGVALRALLAASAAGRGVGPAVTVLVLAPLVLVVAGLVALAQVVLGEELDRYEQCMLGANTHTSRDACQQQLRDAVLGSLGGVGRA